MESSTQVFALEIQITPAVKKDNPSVFLHNENRVGEKEEDIVRNYHTKAILSDGNYYMYHGSRGAADAVISQILAETNLADNSIEYLE